MEILIKGGKGRQLAGKMVLKVVILKRRMFLYLS